MVWGIKNWKTDGWGKISKIFHLPFTFRLGRWTKWYTRVVILHAVNEIVSHIDDWTNELLLEKHFLLRVSPAKRGNSIVVSVHLSVRPVVL